jgi:hypothetical protein
MLTSPSKVVRIAAALLLALPLAAASEPPRQERERERGGDERGGGHEGGGHEGGGHDDGEDRERGEPRIVIDDVALSAWDDGARVGALIQLRNQGFRRARDVRVRRVLVSGGSYDGPAALPILIGVMRSGEDKGLDAVLKVPADGKRRWLAVEGDLRRGRERVRTPFQARFRIAPDDRPPAPPAPQPGQSTVQRVGTAIFPPARFPNTYEPNAEQPILIPPGPFRQVFPPTPSGTGIGDGISGGTPGVSITPNSPFSPAFANAIPPDPNAATSGPGPHGELPVVMTTGNLFVSYSLDGGLTFTNVNPKAPQPGNPSRATFFPESDGGLCCDQVVIYLPAQDLFVWLLQYNPSAGATPAIPPASRCGTPGTITASGRLRLAWAHPADIRSDFWNAWTWADLTGNAVAGVGDGLGIRVDEWLDYPDLAYSDRFLYVMADHGCNTPGVVFSGRRLVARLSLADISNPAAGVVHYDYTELSGSSGLNKSHFVQNAPGRMLVGSLDSSSKLRVFSWPDGDSGPGSAALDISSIPQNTATSTVYTALAPDGNDWLASSFPGNITGATYRSVIPGLGQPSRDEYTFAFDAGKNPGGSRPRAYVRLETVTPSGGGYSAVEEYDIWNNDYAFAMAALGTQGSEIGMVLAVGDGTVGYPQMSVGFKNDFLVWQVTGSNATQAAAGGGMRFGDYFCTRLVPGPDGKFATLAYDVLLNPLPAGVTTGTCATYGCLPRPRYVEFGRPPPPPIK